MHFIGKGTIYILSNHYYAYTLHNAYNGPCYLSVLPHFLELHLARALSLLLLHLHVIKKAVVQGDTPQCAYTKYELAMTCGFHAGTKH